jgi:OPA family sugar phosphate sensor protein UhpC-like MFS transporter
MLLGMAVVELSHRKAAGTASGFASGWVAYVGAMFAGYPIGKIIDNWGWYGYFSSMGVSIIMVFLLIAPIWKASTPFIPKRREAVS